MLPPWTKEFEMNYERRLRLKVGIRPIIKSKEDFKYWQNEDLSRRASTIGDEIKPMFSLKEREEILKEIAAYQNPDA